MNVSISLTGIMKVSKPKIIGNHAEPAKPHFDRAEFKDETNMWEIPISYPDGTEDIAILEKDEYSPLYKVS